MWTQLTIGYTVFGSAIFDYLLPVSLDVIVEIMFICVYGKKHHRTYTCLEIAIGLWAKLSLLIRTMDTKNEDRAIQKLHQSQVIQRSDSLIRVPIHPTLWEWWAW